MEHLPQGSVVSEPDVRKGLIEAIDCTTIHFLEDLLWNFAKHNCKSGGEVRIPANPSWPKLAD
jgi:hypothetical protein